MMRDMMRAGSPRFACRLFLVGAVCAGLCTLLPVAAGASGTTHERLTRLADDVIHTSARFDPMLATALGLPGLDGELAIPSEAARAARLARLQGWQGQLETIVRSAGREMALVDANDARLLAARFTAELRDLQVRRTDRKNYAGPCLLLNNAIYTQFLHLPMPGRDGAVQSDSERAWRDIIARLARGPAYIRAGQALVTHPGRLYGVVGALQIAGIPDFLNGALTDAARAQLAALPEMWARFTAARDAVLATVTQTQTYLGQHVATWPENFSMGKASYNAMLRDEQLLPFDAGDVERMGRDELAHGWAEEAWLASASAYRKQPFGPASGGGMAPGGPALVDYYRDRIAELRRFVVEHDVVTVPDWLGSMQIVETPAFLQPVSPGASMNPPRLFEVSGTGYYFITPPRSLDEAAQRLDMNEDFDRDRILSTGAHEAIPGHFFQLSIARRHPDIVRRIQDAPSFAEGWAFYGEEMFVRLGLYGDDLDGRLFTARWERVRGARAIVDVKLATGEWSVAQATDFFQSQSGFTRAASEAAVAGYALGPGYVIAYTVGRLQLENLLAEYLQRMGERASLRDFHDRLLSYGTTPFSVVAPELLADLDKPASAVRAAANF